VREAVRQDDVGEYAITNDDELVRCHVRKGCEGCGGAGVGGLERGVEQDGRTEVVRDGFGLELGGVVASPGCVGDDEDARGPKGTQGLGPGNLDGKLREIACDRYEVAAAAANKRLLFEGRKAHLDFRNELVVMREGLKGGRGRVARC